MYPVTLGFSQAEARILELLANGHSAEALLTCVFTFEKTLRRALKYCIIARGFTSKQSEEVLGQRGFQQLVKLWPCFAPQHQTLPAFVGKKWQYVQPAVTMRNKLVHGERVFDLADCNTAATQMLGALNDFRTQLQTNVSFDGWSRIPIRRKGRLSWYPHQLCS
jgi:hypothetical protein